MKPRRPPVAAQDPLALMPRAVRDKLDRVGIKLHLKEWELLPLAERARLRDLPCRQTTEIAHYASTVEALVLRFAGHPADRIAPRP